MDTITHVLENVLGFSALMRVLFLSGNKDLKSVAIVRHEDNAKRDILQSDLISTFNKLLLRSGDLKNTFWMDNCASQNKNWAIYSFILLIPMIRS